MRLIDVEHIPYEDGFDRENSDNHFILGVETMQEWIRDQETVSIEKLNPHPTEAIVMRFNFTDFSFDKAKRIFDSVRSSFPDNTVVCIPDYASLQSCGKDTLRNIISMISRTIEAL